MSDNSSIGARGFISYTRKDNDDFANVVDRLKTELEGRFAAATGRKLQIFLDRESIGWGADWRGSIRDSVKSATFFIPIVTMRYFDSAACREELSAFYENAHQLGVTELILPLVLAGADEIKADDPRDEVRLIESLNYKNIEDAWLAGYDSSNWLRAVHSMVAGLKGNLAAAETALASKEAATVAAAPGDGGEQDEESAPDASALYEDFAELTSITSELTDAMKEFGEAVKLGSAGVDMKSLPPSQQQAALVRMAHALKEPAEQLALVGGRFEKRVSGTDAQLRAVIEELRSIDSDAAQQQANDLVAATGALNQLSPVVEQMSGFVQMLRLAALTNVSIRRSLQPAIQGLQSISSGMATAESWRAL